jgi:hypothetical protein
MNALRSAVLAARFLLELGALAALAWWGFRRDGGWILRTALGIGAPLLAAAVWGLLIAPRARQRLPDPWLLVAELAVFAAAGAALAASGRPGWGSGFVLLAALTSVLVRVWGL